MKVLFAAILSVLIAASLLTAWMSPDMSSDVPVLYWATDANPARVDQIEGFERWLVRSGYVKPGDEHKPLEQRRPICIVRTDTSNNDPTKKIIQGVSGVGDDLMSVATFGGEINYFHSIGLLADVTDEARRLGFGLEHTWPVSVPGVLLSDTLGRKRLCAFPANVFHQECVVNKAIFEKYGLPIPPRRWTFEEFEEQGKRFVEAANRGKKRQDVFFADFLSTPVLAMSMGLPTYNETLTACIMDDARYARAVRLKMKWTFEDHILPAPADWDAMTTGAASLQGGFSLFANGTFGMVWTGRYALCELRKFGSLRLSVSEPPNGGFPVVAVGTFATGVYAGSRHKDLAMLFLAFQASEDFNMQIVRSGDSLPPDPKYCETSEFLHPADHPEEWGLHEAFADAARQIGVSPDVSPFLAPGTADRIRSTEEDSAMSRVISPEQAGRNIARRVNGEIRRTVAENPKLRPRYETLLARQWQIDERVGVWKQIESLKSRGEPVPEAVAAKARKIPMAWIESPFYRRYYQYKGWVE